MTDLTRIKETLNSHHWQWLLDSLHQEKTILEFLLEKLPHINRDSWPERFSLGGIFINGRPVEIDFQLKPPCKIEYFEPKYQLNQIAGLYPSFNPESHVVFEDDYLLIAFKPAGLPSKPPKEQKRYSLSSSLEKYTRCRVHMPSRLDTATSGLIIASKKPETHPPLQSAFENREIEKFYLFEACGSCSWKEQIVDTAIDKDPRHPVLRKTVSTGGKSAKTLIHRLIDSNFETPAGDVVPSRIFLAKPLTGRTHQIRVHAASLGLNIIGDSFYGGLDADNLHLLSYALRFKHPLSGGLLEVLTPENLLPAWAVKLCRKAKSDPAWPFNLNTLAVN